MWQKLMHFAAVNLPTMHIGWPIGIRPVIVAYWLALSSPSHFRTILEAANSGSFGTEAATVAEALLQQPRAKSPI